MPPPPNPPPRPLVTYSRRNAGFRRARQLRHDREAEQENGESRTRESSAAPTYTLAELKARFERETSARPSKKELPFLMDQESQLTQAEKAQYHSLIVEDREERPLPKDLSSVIPAELNKEITRKKSVQPPVTQETIRQYEREKKRGMSARKAAKALNLPKAAPKLPQYYSDKYTYPFFNATSENFYHAFTTGGEYSLYEEFHTEDQYQGARRSTGARHPTTFYFPFEVRWKEVAPLFAMYEEELIREGAKGTPGNYFRNPAKRGFLPESPDQSGNNPAFKMRYENYILMMHDKHGRRFSIGEFRELLDILVLYLEDLKVYKKPAAKIATKKKPVRAWQRRNARKTTDGNIAYSSIPQRRSDQSRELLELVAKIDTAVQPSARSKRRMANQRRYIHNGEDVAVALAWMSNWRRYLAKCQSDYNLTNDDEVPKDVCHVGYTYTPNARMKEHMKHGSSGQLLDLVDAAAIAVSERRFPEGRVVRMRYHTLRLIHAEKIAEESEHFDSMVFLSYFWLGGTNTVFGGGSNQSASKYPHLYKENLSELEAHGHFLNNYQGMLDRLDTEVKRRAAYKEARKLKKDFDQRLHELGPRAQKGKEILEEVHKVRKQTHDLVEQEAEKWRGVLEPWQIAKVANGHLREALKGMVELGVHHRNVREAVRQTLENSERPMHDGGSDTGEGASEAA
ncbi:hypothetical protein CAC42_5023 [Sphaceloma murrayae]|uniref:Uncharacterized protein n=1 Tax=Sphaceloma murrayae TaxID=2082308 RepID=A0A2K1QQ21_9PEZI|nr:hypothetical protein CAC42_5023 [Sphaceloma murrayae]